MGRKRLLAATLLLPLSAAAAGAVSVELAAGRRGYDWTQSSMSRLGESGTQGAAVFALALALVGLAIVAAAASGATARAGVLYAPAGVLLIAAALVPLSPTLAWVTLLHRVLTGAALVSLSAATWVSSRPAGLVAFLGLAAGAGLLHPGFPGGLWERALFAFLLAWLELLLIRSGTKAAS